jgi:hypothetical protein
MTELFSYPIALVAVILIAQLCKSKIAPKFGKAGVQLFVAFISFLIAGIFIAKDFLSPETLGILVTLWVTANGVYQVIGKKLFELLGEAGKIIFE